MLQFEFIELFLFWVILVTYNIGTYICIYIYKVSYIRSFFVKVNNKNELDNNLNNFLRLIKLEAHFKDSINNDTNDKNRMFKENKNKDWTPSKNHHTIDTHIGKCSNLKQVHPNFNKG